MGELPITVQSRASAQFDAVFSRVKEENRLKGLHTPQALFFGEISLCPISHFSPLKSPETRASTGWNRGDRFGFQGGEFNATFFPGLAYPCTLSPGKRLARFPAIRCNECVPFHLVADNPVLRVQTANPANLGLYPGAIEAPRSRPPHRNIAGKDPSCLGITFPADHNNRGRPSPSSQSSPGQFCVTVVMVVTVTSCCFRRRKRRYAPARRASHVVGFLHSGRNISLAVQHTPDIDVVWALKEKNEVRIVRQRPSAQPRQVEFVGVAG